MTVPSLGAHHHGPCVSLCTPGCAPCTWSSSFGLQRVFFWTRTSVPVLSPCWAQSALSELHGSGQHTPQHLSLASSCHPNPPFLWNVTQFKFLTNPLLLDPKGWSRALILPHLLQFILHPERNPSACFSDALTQHLCSELSTHRAHGCSESCQYSHHLKENQENYLRQKKQISCADRINTFGVWLCLSSV